MGWLRHLEDPALPWFEYQYLVFLKKCLTEYWEDLQCDVSMETLEKLHCIMNVLELDRKARMQLMFLYNSGMPGRTCANQLLWDLLSDWALDPVYEDLSYKVRMEVLELRKTFDRPPGDHEDLFGWTWERYKVPLDKYWRWSPKAVPRRVRPDLPLPVRTYENGRPLEPPYCWGEFQ